jgi:pimeloyl-ACP methyl ester carboxylesterase
MRAPSALGLILASGLSTTLAACALKAPVNPSFSISAKEARGALREMRRAPKRLERPLIVLGGYLDPGIGPWWTARRLRELTRDRRVLAVDVGTCASFAACRKRLIDEVERAFPISDPEWTAEVDALAISMGGLVARDAAASAPDDGDETTPPAKRLKLKRLFSISTPHRGARLASMPCFLEVHRDMRPGSEFLKRLEAAYAEKDYAVFPYVRLGDSIVGPENAAPRGEHPIWVSNPFFQPAHIGAALDSRIFADLVRRLRGEEPFANDPRSPLPDA